MIITASIIVGVFVLFANARPAREFTTTSLSGGSHTENSEPETKNAKTLEERIREARTRSANVKGLYMTADVADDRGKAGTRLRDDIINIAEKTEINGIVIDVKEVCGSMYNEIRLRELLADLHKKNIWAIARIVVFKDASLIDTHPEWYLKRSFPRAANRDECANRRYLRVKHAEGNLSDPSVFWRDARGGYWLDPAHPEAGRYLIDFSKRIIDLGFDELQFDYIRFPSDGDVENAVYPRWDGKTPKYIVMKMFFELLNRELKMYKPEIILSADMFGYAAIRAGDVGIGQRLDDIGDTFDYISFMVYPSHYYNGLALPADPAKGLPAINFSHTQARMNPDIIVGRTLQFARDFLDGRISTSTTLASAVVATSTTVTQRSRAKLRPWLEDFYHSADRAAGRPWGAQKVRMQIDAAQAVDPHGWLLWNASNVYTENALKKENP